jgi:hypothetical protein
MLTAILHSRLAWIERGRGVLFGKVISSAADRRLSSTAIASMAGVSRGRAVSVLGLGRQRLGLARRVSREAVSALALPKGLPKILI